ncbi:Multicopper oxidase with three cupredoxin domains (includes cell division protein FtsP and spore coat protein CotA) [Reichenbachiella agariperforans]|uniref:Multicopper oxidase with three cupredoxin domains (Includes cell division protein FtsP and spore coat protein CotA) n=1 Tax=Reichenbachiella agariperforans TaxID=156994 RepID=A0A1M6UBP9_REIAG|nr:multicopper oxidase family protein [Reichenbachiella agariperforans]SHK66606.1 Multicopper oxidase with three cupredoxin domains (includes cell division protein FtsP and spore coat protein CotA) [Reichenbachiella agariperforans]
MKLFYLHRFQIVYILFFSVIFSCQEPVDARLTTRATSDILSEIANIQSSLRPSSALLKNQEQGLVYLPFANPEEISSIDGKLDTEMVIKFATNRLYNTIEKKNIELYHRSYNGRLVGPTLRVKPGDSLLVNLINKLPVYENPGPCDPYQPLHDDQDPNIIDSLRFNNTNLHTHGLHVSPMAHGDNVFVNLAPGCDFQNRIAVPLDHASGTFWYHAHVHGSTAIQVSSGMGGTILIEGGLDDQPQIKEMDEKVFVMQQIPYVPDTGAGGDPNRYALKFIEDKTFGPGTWGDGIKDSTGWRTTINGMVLPVIEIESEEAQRWRFVHAGVRETLNLKLIKSKEGKVIHEKLYAIAEDGIAYGYRSDIDSMLLQPGYRADLLVQAKLTDGLGQDTLYLIDASSPVLDETNTDEYESERVLALVVLKAKTTKPVARQLPTSVALRQYAPYPSLVNVPVTDTMQYVNFEIKPGDTTLFQINNVSFDHSNPPRTLGLNNIQEWTLTSSLGGHPFHIHINHFQIQERYTKGNNQWIKQQVKPIWKDTYFVPSSDSIVLKTVYKDFVGDFVLHCHILDHEDQGMMQCVRIDSANTIGNYLLDQGIEFCGPQYTNSLTSN